MKKFLNYLAPIFGLMFFFSIASAFGYFAVTHLKSKEGSQLDFYEKNAAANDASAFLMSSVAKCSDWNVKGADYKCVRLAVDSSTVGGKNFHEKVKAEASRIYPGLIRIAPASE